MALVVVIASAHTPKLELAGLACNFPTPRRNQEFLFALPVNASPEAHMEQALVVITLSMATLIAHIDCW